MSNLTSEMIRDVLERFYEKIRADRELGPVFQSIIGDGWEAHLDKITSFWLTATRVGDGYCGRNFMPAHLRHASIQPAQLPRWLELFSATCRERCAPQDADRLIDIAQRMAENIGLSLNRRG